MHWPWSDLQAAHLLCCVPLHPKTKPPAWLISQNFCNYKKGQISPSLLLEPNRDASFSSSLQEHQWSVSAWKAEHGNKIWKLEKDWRDWMICGTFRSYIVTERAVIFIVINSAWTCICLCVLQCFEEQLLFQSVLAPWDELQLKCYIHLSIVVP